MSDRLRQELGWKPIPMPLKILAVVMCLWSIGSVMNLPNLMEDGLPLFGTLVHGPSALFVVLLLDLIGPLLFLYALWNKKPWAPMWAFTYIGIFILNSAVAHIVLGDQIGLPQILVPTIVSMGFLAVIFWKRSYFVLAD